jgi:hypothetical protein
MLPAAISLCNGGYDNVLRFGIAAQQPPTAVSVFALVERIWSSEF